MHCTNCGANLTNTDKFCKACGYSVNGNYSNNNYNCLLYTSDAADD